MYIISALDSFVHATRPYRRLFRLFSTLLERNWAPLLQRNSHSHVFIVDIDDFYEFVWYPKIILAESVTYAILSIEARRRKTKIWKSISGLNNRIDAKKIKTFESCVSKKKNINYLVTNVDISILTHILLIQTDFNFSTQSRRSYNRLNKVITNKNLTLLVLGTCEQPKRYRWLTVFMIDGGIHF